MKNFSLFFLLCFFLHNRLKAQDFEPTVAFIKDKITCCTIPFSGSDSLKVSGIEITKNGLVKIFYTGKKGPLSFSLLALYKENDSASGIELYNNSRLLQFHINAEKTRTIRFASHEAAKDVYTAFQNLLKLCKANNEVMNPDLPFSQNNPVVALKPPDAAYFISRNTVLKTENTMLLNSIRAADKKDEGDTTFLINSKGEGWLDKDSLPAGRWNFYAKDKSGKEYRFKSGVYSPTKASMFEIKNMDSAGLKNKYGLSYASLQEEQSRTIPFVKSKIWNFYHPNGRLWKQVRYQAQQIPVEVSVSAALTENGPERLLILLKEDLDEWINTEVIEYNEEGKTFKKLQYYGFSQVYKKTLYGKNGKVLKVETAIPYTKEVLPENY
jgi:hypothetical protein